MANDTSSKSYIFSFKLVSGYNVITLPNNVIVPNLKNITVKKLSYNFNQLNQYSALLSIQGYDLHNYSDGVSNNTYLLSFFNPTGVQNSQINYINYTNKPDVSLSYGAPMPQLTLVFDTDYGSNYNGVNLGLMSTGGSPFVSATNPLFVELCFE